MAEQKNILINGLVLSWVKSITGIPRYCREIIYRLDKIQDNEVKFYYIYDEEGLNKIINPSELKNIETIAVRNPKHKEKQENAENPKRAILWRSKLIKKYAKQLNAKVFCLAMETVLCKKQVSVIHDIRPLVTKFDSFKFRFKHKILLKVVKSWFKDIFTVSNYQKELISKHLRFKKDRIKVAYPGYEQMNEVIPDEEIFKKFSEIKKGEYYFALGSLAPHKNFKWIIEIARRNLKNTFVIAGGKDIEAWKDNIEVKDIANLIFTGYVSDEECKALYQNAKAFLHPSKFEGFGTPPLEALSLGTKVAVANSTCLPEIYEDSVLYFDPDDYCIEIDEFIKGETQPSEKILEKCNYDNCTKEIYDYLKNLNY